MTTMWLGRDPSEPGLLVGLLVVVWCDATAAPQLRRSPPLSIADRHMAQRTFDADAALMVRFVRPEMAGQGHASAYPLRVGDVRR